MYKLKKIAAWNLLQKLGSLNWEADQNTLKQTAMALYYSTAEYCAPVWSQSSHTIIIDSELNKGCRIITGTLQPTPLDNCYCLATITPLRIRRNVATRKEKRELMLNSRHPLHGHMPVLPRFKSRKSFAKVTLLEHANSQQHEWNYGLLNSIMPRSFPSQPHQKTFNKSLFFGRKDWCCLNRARCKVGRTKVNLYKWKMASSPAQHVNVELRTRQWNTS